MIADTIWERLMRIIQYMIPASATAWASLTAARRVSVWIAAPFMMEMKS
jgi:hypothetical protein